MVHALPVETTDIVVTASRVPQGEAQTPASVTIIDQRRIERLGEPLVPSLLRLAPSVAVATSGPAGSLTEVRIRGAEANHTLLFVDGIRANDPAAGNIPRFELLNGDLFSRIEVVRGPQSALWGSEAIGGAISVSSGSGKAGTDLSWLGEAGSFRFRRAAVQADRSAGGLDLSGALGWQRAAGIDSFGGNGDRDGYRNVSGRARAALQVSDAVQVGFNGFALSGRSEFDGYSPVTFLRADTLDSTRNKLSAARLWAKFGKAGGGTSGNLAASLLRSANRNLLDAEEVNRTTGRRANVSGQVEQRFATGSVKHLLIAAVEHEREEFRARDVIYGGFSDQDQNRKHQSVTAEWKADVGRVQADVAVRRDIFSRFDDATTLRASLLTEIGEGVAVFGSYGEGIAQPSFFDLYGFFPGSFVGNPDLKPERSRGFELGGRLRKRPLRAALTVYRQRLSDEIVDVFDSTTFLSSTLNRSEKSRRWGAETELGYEFGALTVSANYVYLKASQPAPTGSQVREIRRPKHSGSVSLDGVEGRITYGAAVAYSGERFDTDFDSFPARTVRLDPYWHASARVAYRIEPRIELFGRVSNAFDDDSQDVSGYRREGRSVHGGIRIAARR